MLVYVAVDFKAYISDSYSLKEWYSDSNRARTKLGSWPGTYFITIF